MKIYKIIIMLSLCLFDVGANERIYSVNELINNNDVLGKNIEITGFYRTVTLYLNKASATNFDFDYIQISIKGNIEIDFFENCIETDVKLSGTLISTTQHQPMLIKIDGIWPKNNPDLNCIDFVVKKK